MIPILIKFKKHTSKTKMGLEQSLWKDNNHPKQHITILEAAVTITLQLGRKLQQCKDTLRMF
jgi:hypothetical protein